jgi:hypothetical protein
MKIRALDLDSYERALFLKMVQCDEIRFVTHRARQIRRMSEVQKETLIRGALTRCHG